MKRRYLILLALLLVSPLSTAGDTASNGLWAHHSVEEEFDTIKEYIGEAITNQGLVIAHSSDVAGMLDRTGKDLVSRVQEGAERMMEMARNPMGVVRGERTEAGGSAPESTFVQSEVIEFCSARLSRKMTDADPANVIFCPYSIALYTTSADPKTVHISYLQLSRIGSEQSRPVLEEVEEMLAQIVSEATE